MPPTPLLAAILSTGTELTLGELVDTNGPWLARKLADLGFVTTSLRQLGDDLPSLVEHLRVTRGKVAVVLFTGGLGPTTDDLTAEAFATAFERPLTLFQDQLDRIKTIFQFLNRPFPEINAKQAWLPTGCQVLENNYGTAPGWLLEDGGTIFAAMPGVPGEMKPMFDDQVVPFLRQRFALEPLEKVILQTVGSPESRLQETLTPFQTRHPSVFVRFAAHWHGVEVKLGWLPGAERESLSLSEIAEEAKGLLTGHVYAEGPTTLEAVIGGLLRAQGATLATAESYTGGRIAQALTSVPGSSDYFDRGFVTYSNAAKMQHLSVPEALLQEFGAVSAEVAKAMAEGARAAAGTTYGLSTTGIAGPTGATETKPVGLTYCAVAGPRGTFFRKSTLPGQREQIQARGAAAGLFLLWRYLTGKDMGE